MIFLFYKRHLSISIIKKNIGKDHNNFLFIKKNKNTLSIKVLLIIKNKIYKNKVFNLIGGLNCNYQIFKNNPNLYKTS